MENTSSGSEQKRARAEGTTTISITTRIEWAINALREHLESHDGSRKRVQDKLHEACDRWWKQVDELEEAINNELKKNLQQRTTVSKPLLTSSRQQQPQKQSAMSAALQLEKGRTPCDPGI